MGEKEELVYNNIADLDFDGEDYLFFPNEKEYIAQAFIPKRINIGARNQTISAIANQIRALNPDQSIEGFTNFIIRVNRSRCTVPLEDSEVLRIVNKILSMDFIEPIFNKPRRIVFNPKSKLTKGEKTAITNKFLGMLRSNQTKDDIKECLLSWDRDKLGKVTQKTLALVAKKNIKTIEKYYKEYKQLRDKINNNTS